MTDNEILVKILGELESIKSGQENLVSKVDSLEAGQKSLVNDVKEIKVEVKYIKKQVDIVYDWVDGIDLRVKALEKVI